MNILTRLTQEQLAALILVAATMVEQAPEAASLAAHPFITPNEFKSFAKVVGALKMEVSLPSLSKAFEDGFESLGTPARLWQN